MIERFFVSFIFIINLNSLSQTGAPLDWAQKMIQNHEGQDKGIYGVCPERMPTSLSNSVVMSVMGGGGDGKNLSFRGFCAYLQNAQINSIIDPMKCQSLFFFLFCFLLCIYFPFSDHLLETQMFTKT